MESQSQSNGGRIVVGIDGSQSSRAALRWAADQAARTGGSLEIMTAWAWPNSYGWVVPIPEGYDPKADAERLLASAAAEVRQDHPGLETRTSVLQGHPAPALVDASRGAALLVVGSRGLGEFTGMLLGSVSEHCAAHAHCPVLVFRSDDPSG